MATPQAAVAMVSGAVLTAITFFVPNMRCVFWIGSSLIGLAGALMVHLLDAEAQRDASLAGVYLMGFYNVPWVFMLSLSSSNTAGATKKSFMGVSIAVVYGQYKHFLLALSAELTRASTQRLAISLDLNSFSRAKHRRMPWESDQCYSLSP